MGNTIFHGIVRGKNIELDEAPPIPNGVQVTVQIYSLQASGDGIRASAGAWADAGDELERWLDEVYRARQSGRNTDQS